MIDQHVIDYMTSFIEKERAQKNQDHKIMTNCAQVAFIASGYSFFILDL